MKIYTVDNCYDKDLLHFNQQEVANLESFQIGGSFSATYISVIHQFFVQQIF